MQFPWLPLVSPPDLEPIPDLYFLDVDEAAPGYNRSAIENALTQSGLLATTVVHPIELNIEPDGGFEVASDHPDPTPKASIGRGKGKVRSAGLEAAEEDAPPSHPPDEEDEGIATVWRAGVGSAVTAPAARNAVRGLAGVRHFNPVYGADGREDGGLFSYGRLVVLALRDAKQVSSIRSELERHGIAASAMRPLVEALPMLTARPILGMERLYVLTLPPLSEQITAGVAGQLDTSDASAVASALPANGNRFALPDWIQLDVRLPDGGRQQGGATQSVVNERWWLEACDIPNMLDRLRAEDKPALALVDLGFDLDLAPVAFRRDVLASAADLLFRRQPFTKDPNGITAHGTRCAVPVSNQQSNTVPCVSPKIEIVPIRIGLRKDGRYSVSDLELAVGVLSAWVNKVGVVCTNIQMARMLPVSTLMIGTMPLLEILVVAPSGNYQTTGRDPGWGREPDVAAPARHPSVLAIGGCDSERVWAEWPGEDGNVGARWLGRLDFAGPSEEITTITKVNSPVGPLNGTSFAAPISAGVAAVLRAIHPSAQASAVRDALLHAAAPRNDERLGRGVLDASAALLWLDSQPTPPEETLNMPLLPPPGSTSRFDWGSFFIGLSLAISLAVAFLVVAGRGDGRDDEVGGPADPHLPLPTAFGDIRSCRSGSLLTQYNVDLLRKDASGTFVYSDTYVAGANSAYGYHYDFGPLANGVYKVVLVGNTSTIVTCPVTHEFTISGGQMVRYDLYAP